MMNEIIFLAQQAPTPAPGAPQGPPQWTGMVSIFLVFGVMIFLMFRSQKKQANERKEMLNAIKSGDKVITNGGIKGTVDKVKDDLFILKIADNVRIEIVHAGIAKKIVDKENNE